MKIAIITCHDVYNFGASLQAYALAEYLKRAEHEVQIIDYKPDYLSRHYSLSWVANPRFDRHLIRQAYLLAKLPGRLKALKSVRKKRFDAFRQAYLPVTARRYGRFEELVSDCPEADLYIAGSDQIWNPVFPNGKDPAFFLAFVPEGKKRISYAASFAVERLSAEDRERMKPWLERLEGISVRESSGVEILAGLGVDSTRVMDPVFLLGREHWEEMAVRPEKTGYVLVYDFDSNLRIREAAEMLAGKCGKQIVSVFPMEGAAEIWSDMGPCEFLGAILNADIVLSNSFHATAFSLIFQKVFFVVNREEKINARMLDLLAAVSLNDRLLFSAEDIRMTTIPWESVEGAMESLISESKRFLSEQTIR